ncbi:hypothetical protein NQ315_009652 [Exocentrus adspersus]|uniref:Uncharacterized protein n=1 Tax=Exocentrus adspersus TaxID=1586481 RepID=A0AAV8WGW0_9CUCU|nr:hypothetical protein NQ315_009652 [Exocentrus adspersus]
MVNASGGVVWCYKDDKWIPLQLSSIRLHGVLTQAHWAAISEFLQRVANKQLVLQDNGFTELTDRHKELMLQQSKNLDDKNLGLESENVIKLGEKTGSERKVSLGQIPEDKVMEQPRRPSMPELRSIHSDNLFINNLFKSETDNHNHKKTDRISKENDEIVLRLLKKYCKYSKDALDNEIVSAIEQIADDEINNRSRKTSVVEFDNQPRSKMLNSMEHHQEEVPPRVRKMGYVPREEIIYENVNDFPLDSLEEDKNEHVIRWLKQQNSHIIFDNVPVRRHSAVDIMISSPTDSRKSSFVERKSSSSGFESRKSSLTTPSTPESRKSSWCDSTLNSRKSSVGSNSSCSECDDTDGLTQWQKFVKKHLNAKNSERRLKKQWQAWSRNKRKLSSSSDTSCTDLASQP